MRRQSSTESNRETKGHEDFSPLSATATDSNHGDSSDSELSNYDATEHMSRQSNISSYAEYTESDDEEVTSEPSPSLRTNEISNDEDFSKKTHQILEKLIEEKLETDNDDDTDNEENNNEQQKENQDCDENQSNRNEKQSTSSRRSSASSHSLRPKKSHHHHQHPRHSIHSHQSNKKHHKPHSSTKQNKSSTNINQNAHQDVSKKKHYDHKPHDSFVQLDELYFYGDDAEWQETARWIKYEENLEEGSGRWGRPHVPTLSFQSLLSLRNCLETGVVLFDVEEQDLPGTAYKIVEQMVKEDLIHRDDKAQIMRALLGRHRHVTSFGGFHFGRRKSSYNSMQNIIEGKRNSITNDLVHRKPSHNGTDTKIDIRDEILYATGHEMQADSIVKRIPGDSEATSVLVGAVEFLEQPTIAFVRLAEGICMPGVIEAPIPVRFIFVLLGPKTCDLDFHEIGRSIATLMSNRHFQAIAYKAHERQELLTAINEFLDDSIVLPAGKWDREHLLPFEELKAKSEMIRSRRRRVLEEKLQAKKNLSNEEKKLLSSTDEKVPDDPLNKTGRYWGGMINDIKRRFPMYKSDIEDGLNSETLAATLFLYFAGLATSITFGGLIGEKTRSSIGISETLVSSCMVGMIFHALSSQPLVFVGTSGPLILFDEALFQFCSSMSFNFLTVRVYIGIWLTIIALTLSAFEGSVYVRLFSRFTQEIFSALITLIYIVETVQKTVANYQRHPLLSNYPIDIPISARTIDETSIIAIGHTTDDMGPINKPNTALFCTLLTLGTFCLAYFLKVFRNSKFLGRNTRRALGDFGVPIAIATFVTFDYFVPHVYTDKLNVPDGISPSDPEQRDWMIPFAPIPLWIPIASIIPAFLVFILIFMETEISELIVGKPERGLKKGNGLHWDIVLLCLCNTICGYFGMPWHCAATVRSVTHVSAVTIMSTNHAPGDTPKIVDIKEQRLSGFFVSLMIGLSLFASPLLKEVPMAVLFGVFLYMGVCSMVGVQFFERLRLLFMPVKHHPQVPFVRRVQTWKMHSFTVVQVLALTVLWIVKSSKFSLAFPFFLIMMVPLRAILGKFFTSTELRALDCTQRYSDSEIEPDFYEQAPLPA
ncbi:band 3 anion transport protein-like [Chironomus tepperi]|uniref:band 3 anion transport protein-like n=1 Tax=Chironomus tepperi TaxID=113505 RepID=UPI00391EE846